MFRMNIQGGNAGLIVRKTKQLIKSVRSLDCQETEPDQNGFLLSCREVAPSIQIFSMEKK